MPIKLSISELASLDGRGYVNEIKARLRNDTTWVELQSPILIERTRWGLTRLIESIDDQVERAALADDAEPNWLRSVTSLKRLAQNRLDRLVVIEPEQSSSKEARAWKAFAARLARVLGDNDPAALQRLQAPYGGLTAAEWLTARDEKREEQH